MANRGANTNGFVLAFSRRSPAVPTFYRSQFYITFKPASNLDKKHTVFGKLVGGEDVLYTLEKLPRKEGTERPLKPVKITEVKMYVPDLYERYRSLRLYSHQDPFEDYKVRLAKKLAKKAEAQSSISTQQETAEKKAGDGMNWFGVKLGTESGSDTTTMGRSGPGGVGKYLNLKRPGQAAAATAEPVKKRKLGFGEFENF
jgi:peptidyl-prolyl cis-trans isomerase-like protein 2